MSRVLYHYLQSVFSRRTLLALAHKGLEVELRDGRADPLHAAEGRRLFPLGTLPVLVDDGRVIGDSTSIAQYLDLAYPDRPRLWPVGPALAGEAVLVTTAVDLAMNTLVELGTRYYELRGDPAWSRVVAQKMERAQAAIDLVAAKATRPTLVGETWGAPEIWAASTALWVSAFPERAATTPNVAQMLSLGFVLPPVLLAWAREHRARRPDLQAVFA
jgi:glutathione S-transferase